MSEERPQPIRISKRAYKKILAEVHRIEKETGSRSSMAEALDRLLEISAMRRAS